MKNQNGGEIVLKWKIDVLKALKDKGYNQTVIRKENLFSQATVTNLRNGEITCTPKVLDKICKLLNCQPGDLLEYVDE